MSAVGRGASSSLPSCVCSEVVSGCASEEPAYKTQQVLLKLEALQELEDI